MGNHEDSGHPLIYFIEELLETSPDKERLPYIFHAGETGSFRVDILYASDDFFTV